MSRRQAAFCAAALAGAFVLRVAYALHAWRAGLVQSYNDGYEWIALNLLRHHRYDGLLDAPLPTAAREPGFPFFIAAVYAVIGRHPFVIVILQCLLGAATCALMADLARKLFGARAGLLTLGVCAVYPYFIFYSAYFFRETLLCFLLAAFLRTLAALYERPGTRLAAAAGGLWGLCAVTFSTFLLLWIPACAWVLGGLWRRRARAPALAAFALSAALLPGSWLARNAVVFHRFIPGSTMGGFNFYTALLVPEDDRGTDREPQIEHADPVWVAIHDKVDLYADDGSQNAAFMKAAEERIRADPRAYLGHVARQAAKLWRLYPYNRSYAHSYGAIKWASLLSDGWLVPLGLFGLWFFRRRDPVVPFMAVLVLGGTVLYSLVSAIVRYRLPFMVALIPLACGLLSAEERRA